MHDIRHIHPLVPDGTARGQCTTAVRRLAAVRRRELSSAGTGPGRSRDPPLASLLPTALWTARRGPWALGLTRPPPESSRRPTPPPPPAGAGVSLPPVANVAAGGAGPSTSTFFPPPKNPWRGMPPKS